MVYVPRRPSAPVSSRVPLPATSPSWFGVYRQMVTIDRFNPFLVNRVGLHGFPLSISLERSNGVFVAHGTALRAADVASSLSGRVAPVSVVMNVGQTAYLDGQSQPLPVTAIAEKQGVDAEVVDVSWAGQRGQIGQLLIFNSSELERFLSGWSLYDVDILWLAAHPSSKRLDEVVLAINTRKRNDPPLLKSLTGAETYFGGHDDCYFSVECRDEELVRLLLGRLLSLLAGSCLVDASEKVTVGEPPGALIGDILGRGASWIGTASLTLDRTINIGLTTGEWRLGQTIPDDPKLTAAYAPETGQWTLEDVE